MGTCVTSMPRLILSNENPFSPGYSKEQSFRPAAGTVGVGKLNLTL